MNAITNWKHWSWLDDGLLPLLLALIRACWFFPWLFLVQRGVADMQGKPLLSVWLIVAIPVASLTLTRWLTARILLAHNGQYDTDPRRTVPMRARITVALGGLAAMALVLWWHYYAGEFALWDTTWTALLGDRFIHWGEALPAPLLTLLTTAYLWQRGLFDAAKRMSHDDIWGAFATGLVAIVFYLVIAVLSGVQLASVDGANLILLFFGLGMAALAFSSLKITVGLDRALGAPQTGTGSQTPRVNRYWLLNTSMVVVGLLGLALLIGVIIAPDNVAVVMNALGTGISFLLRMVGYILLALSYAMAIIFFYLFSFLEPLLQRLMARLSESPLLDTLQRLQENQQEQPELVTDPTVVPDAYRWIGLAVLLAIVAITFALALRRLRMAEPAESDEERNSIFTADLLQEQLGGLLNNLLNRLRNVGDALNPFFALDGEADTRRTIREIYQQLLAGADEKGHARQRSQTPSEYGQQLDDALLSDEAGMAAITDGYLAARYASEPPDRATVKRVQDAWARVRSQFVPDEGEADGSSEDEAT